jgi:hypothetical protein
MHTPRSGLAIGQATIHPTAFRAFADDEERVVSAAIGQRDGVDAVWLDLPVPVSVRLPTDTEMTCEVVIPAHYEPRYAYPLLIWLQPDDGIDFRDRIASISDRNYIGVGLHWSGFTHDAPAAIPGLAQCRSSIETTLATVTSLWNVHPRRACLVAEGHLACGWAARIAQHAPERFASLLCIRPAPWHDEANGFHCSRLAPSLSVLFISSELKAKRSWQRASFQRGWRLQTADASDGDAAERRRFINSWLMEQVLAR